MREQIIENYCMKGYTKTILTLNQTTQYINIYWVKLERKEENFGTPIGSVWFML